MRAVVEPKEEGSVDEEEKVTSVADAVQSAEKAFEMKDATPAVETAAPKAAMQAMMCVLLFAFRFSLSSSCVLIKERERKRARASCVFFSINQFLVTSEGASVAFFNQKPYLKPRSVR